MTSVERAADVVASTTYGKLSGCFEDGVHVFKGVPYGRSTAGPGRFRPPLQPEPWSEVRDAHRWGPVSPQQPDRAEQAWSSYHSLFGPGYEVAPGEDCLHVNIWTPGLRDGTQRPVLVWLHGGGFDTGTATRPRENGASLARQADVVVVAVTHRLGLVGYLHLADVGGEEYATSANSGMLDLVAALEWIRENISEFGGDPGNVTIFGESGGALKVQTLMAMPSARGLFHRAACQSMAYNDRTLARPLTRESATKTAELLLRNLKLRPDRQGVGQLQTLPVERLLAAQASLLASETGRSLRFAPLVDGTLLPVSPHMAVANGSAAQVPLLIGTDVHETLFLCRAGHFPDFPDLRGLAEFLGEHGPRIVREYQHSRPDASAEEVAIAATTDQVFRIPSVRLAEDHARHGNEVFMYLFEWENHEYPEIRATHGIEGPFIFNSTEAVPVTQGRADSRRLACQVSQAWAAFAQTGNPNHPDMPRWPIYDATRRATMVLDMNPHVEEDPYAHETHAWDGIL